MIARVRTPFGHWSRIRPTAGRPAESASNSCQARSAGGSYKPVGVLSATMSPFVARCAQLAATPPSCTTKSMTTSPLAGRCSRTV